MRATGAGTCTITASQAGDVDWAPAADVTTELEIARARQRIELATVPDIVFGAGPQPLAAEAASGLPVSFTSGRALCHRRRVGAGDGGGHVHDHRLPGRGRRLGAGGRCHHGARDRQGPPAHRARDRAGHRLRGRSAATRGRGRLRPAVSFTADGPCVIEGGSVRATGAGTCTITASQAGDVDWAPARRASTRMRIGRGRQRIELTAPDRARVGEPIELSAVADSGLPVGLGVTGACIADGVTVRPFGTGTCSVTASQPGDDDWTAADEVTADVRIGRGRQGIEFAAVRDTVFGAEPQPVSAGSDSGLPVSFTTSGPCSVEDGQVRTIGAGICTVTASQPGDVDWEAAEDVQRSFRVDRASQDITFSSLDAAYLGQPPLLLDATSDSHLGVTYVVTGPCAIDGDRLRLLDAGTCAVTAYQPGDDDWAAAEEAAQIVEDRRTGGRGRGVAARNGRDRAARHSGRTGRTHHLGLRRGRCTRRILRDRAGGRRPVGA